MSDLAPQHERVGREYDRSAEVTRLEQDDPIEYAITARYLQRYVPDGATVADIGVGGGQYSLVLAQRGCRLYLADVSQRLLDAATARLYAAGLSGHVLGARRASATDLGHIPAGCCDAVLLLGPLYHLLTSEDRRQAVGEAARLLRPGGLVFAAGINRLTYLRDVLRGDPDEFARRRAFFDGLFHDGNLSGAHGEPATMHVTTVAELRGELSPTFEEVVLAGVESFASKAEGAAAYLAASLTTREALLDLVERSGVTAEGLGVTSHYLYVGRK
jgi:SAM-dependent methyltransferase